MLAYAAKRILQVIPVALGVSVVCFLLIHLAPGDPLAAILPSDASADLRAQMRALDGLDRPPPVQHGLWLLRALHGDLGQSIATGRPVTGEIAGLARGTWVDRTASGIATLGVSVPHHWLGLVPVIASSVELNWLPATGAGSGGRSLDWPSLRFLVLPAVTAQDFVGALAAKGLLRRQVLRHVLRNVASTALSVMGLQLGYPLGGSILIETVFSWPGTGFLLDTAIFTRDRPPPQGTILVLATVFVFIDLGVDLLQGAIDPRIQR